MTNDNIKELNNMFNKYSEVIKYLSNQLTIKFDIADKKDNFDFECLEQVKLFNNANIVILNLFTIIKSNKKGVRIMNMKNVYERIRIIQDNLDAYEITQKTVYDAYNAMSDLLLDIEEYFEEDGRFEDKPDILKSPSSKNDENKGD